MSKEVFLETKKLSEFTTIAIDEFEKVINMDGYTPYSGDWHWPTNNSCVVCIAGGVMAGLFDVKPTEYMKPDGFSDRNVQKRLKCVEIIRLGKFSEVAERLGVKWPRNLNFKRIEPLSCNLFNDFESAKDLINGFRDRIIPEMIEIEKEIGV